MALISCPSGSSQFFIPPVKKNFYGLATVQYLHALVSEYCTLSW